MTVSLSAATVDSQPASAATGQVARKYQEEIFRQAQKGNVIAYLRTGLGKTLISVLLIRWMCTQENTQDKAIIFFVPKVSLVEQQAQYIHKETGLRVCRLHGALALDFGDREGWKKRFKDHDVFVITPQLYLQLITHSLLTIDKCSLMIFDECHHTRKNHPYNGVMREYFQVKPVSRRPKVFGMTASPYWNEKNPAISLVTLEENLDSKIVGVHEHVEELQNHYSKLHEIIQEYPHPPETYDYPEPTLFSCLQVFHANDPASFDEMDIPWMKIEMRYYTTLNNLGPYCASLYLFAEMQHHMSGLHRKARAILLADRQHDAMDIDIDTVSAHHLKLPPLAMFDILDVLDDYEPFFYSNDSPDTIPISIPLEWCSPKIRVLADLIRSHHSKSFQSIIFVEQRQTASCLAKVLEAIPELQEIVRCGHLVGQGVNSEGISKQTDVSKTNAIKLFREKSINILIATSVAEEGLDFPACDLVIRFDPLQHLVGYVQSRGRARNEVSKYILMIQKDNVAHLERYRALQRGETQLSETYHTRRAIAELLDEEIDDMTEDTDPIDLAERERYIVPSTGAVLTYDNCMNLLNHLCSLIPRDAFTPGHKPIYSGDFQARMRLPAGLPLDPKDLSYLGYPKRTKKEAKRSVAFSAVKRLLRLNVFNEYLLPTSNEVEEEDSLPRLKGKMPPENLQVQVKDPWYMGLKLWLHPLVVGGKRVAALVTGTSLPPVDITFGGDNVSLLPGTELRIPPDEALDRHRLMCDFTTWGISTCITNKPFEGDLSLFLVPLAQNDTVDYDFMELVKNKGSDDWDAVAAYDYEVLVTNWLQIGRAYRLKGTKHELSPLSVPPPGSKEGQYPTYYDYFNHKWTWKNRASCVPRDGPLIEVRSLVHKNSGAYHLGSQSAIEKQGSGEVPTRLVPRNCCRWHPFSPQLYQAFEALPVICRRVTDVYRVRSARLELHLPSLPDNLMIEALTIPMAHLNFSNQRLETLGDAVLELCVTVHLLNHYPNRHEGQLTDLRQQYVSNRHLMYRAQEVGLEHYISCEIGSVQRWRYTQSCGEIDIDVGRPPRLVDQVYPRRSLQDCMEALLGASFLHGGIPMALQTGTSMGLQFGGAVPWSVRYRRSHQGVPIAPLFSNLQELLGYDFRCNDLLVESVTHPSFASSSDGPSYQRLEFLGDAIISLVVVEYLYRKFPEATSHQISFLKAKVICAPALAYLAVKKLCLHKILLANNFDLCKAIDSYVPILEAISDDDIVGYGWKFDPPKAISDVFESIVGAVFVDSGYNYERVAATAEYLMWDLLERLSFSLPKDPVSELMEWAGKEGCRQKIVFIKETKSHSTISGIGIVVQVHATAIVGPLVASTLNVAKFIASERALALLSDTSSQFSLHKLCDCHTKMEVITSTPEESLDDQGSDDANEVVRMLVEAQTEHHIDVEQGDD